jgi:hypothetical protein
MLRNLYKTWGQLAPEEATFWDNEEAVTLQKNQPPCHVWVTTKPWLDGQDALEGYIRRCIISRGWWFELKHSNGYFGADIRTKFEGHEFVCGGKGEDFYCLLLKSYLRCVAAQRQITGGQWERFNGDVIQVVGYGRWDAHSGFGTKDYVSTDQILFRLVEEPKHTVRLNRYCDGSVDYTSMSSIGGWGDRVLYTTGSEGWARKAEDFLGLISEEYPENEGLLRFMENKNA